MRDNPAIDHSTVWPELLMGLWQGVHGASPELREACLLVFRWVPPLPEMLPALPFCDDHLSLSLSLSPPSFSPSLPSPPSLFLCIFSEVPNLFGGQLQTYLTEIYQLLITCLRDAGNTDVQVAASKAFAAFATEASLSKQQRAVFHDVTTVLLETIAGLCQTQQFDECNAHLDALMDLATYVPAFLKPHMPMILQLLVPMLQLRTDEQIERIALEVLMIICEERPQMARKFPDLVNLVFPMCLRMCTEIEDDPTWTQQDAEDVQDDDDIAVIGEQSIDRMSNALGGATILPVAFKHIPAMIVSPEWQQRAAALVSIGALAEGALAEMKPSLSQMMSFIVPCLADPHPRVCYAACNCVGQLAIDFAPQADKEYQTGFQSMFHAEVNTNPLFFKKKRTRKKEEEKVRTQKRKSMRSPWCCETGHSSAAESQPAQRSSSCSGEK